MVQKLEQVDFGSDWTDEKIDKHAQRIERLTRKKLQIFRYLARKRIFVEDDGGFMHVFLTAN